MFFGEALVKNNSLCKAWRAAYVKDDEIANTSLPEICATVDSWVGSEDMNASRRMSLRTSATLVSGVTRGYKHGLQQLFKDVAKLDEDIIIRKRKTSDGSENEEDTPNTSSELYDSPEQMMQHQQRQSDGSFERNVREAIDSLKTPYNSHTFRNSSETTSFGSQPLKRLSSCTIEDINQSSKRRMTDPNQSSGSSHSQVLNDQICDGNTELMDSQVFEHATSSQGLDDRSQREVEGQPELRVSSPTFTEIFHMVADEEDKGSNDNNQAANFDSDGDKTVILESNISAVDESVSQTLQKLPTPKKKTDRIQTQSGTEQKKIPKDQATQTQPCHLSTSEEVAINTNLDPNLPYGILLIHDNYHSRYPSIILFTSLSKDINNILCCE